MTRQISAESARIAAELLASPVNPFVPAVPAAKLPSPEKIHEDAVAWAKNATDEALATCLIETSADTLALRALKQETAEMATIMRSIAMALGVE